MNIVPYIGIIICIMFSAFFSASEIAYASVNKLRLKNKSENGIEKAKIALQISENFNDTLSSILIGNNLVNIAASSIAAVIIINLFGENGTILSTVIMTAIILIFGEITPKTIARKASDKFVLFAAYPLKIIIFILKPVIKVVGAIVNLFSKLWVKEEEEPAITEEDLVTIIENVEDEGIIDEDASDLLQASLEISDISVSDILTPRIDMVTIDFDDDMDTIIDIVIDSPFSRIPVYVETEDNIIGILYVNRFLMALADRDSLDKDELSSMLNEVVYVHKTMKLPEVFNVLNKGKTQMAIVTDEYGGTAGCITVEDILEELVGDIWDESDEIENDIVQTGENTYEVHGDLSIRDFADTLDMDVEDFGSECTTIGGWIIHMNNGLPELNETLEFNHLQFKVLELGFLTISKLSVEVLEIPEEEE